jgi:hypothetical protein
MGSVTLSVTGADGWVTAWVDFNQDGDFDDLGEQVFANEQVLASQPEVKDFAVPVSVFEQTIDARFRVYATAQNLAEAAPSPTGGASGGEVEDYTWDFTPLAVTLADFRAVQQGDAVLLTWETTSELNNQGFNLWRGTSAAGPDRQLNEALIPSQGPGSANGFAYAWEDVTDLVPGSAYYYWLEDVSLQNVVTRHGPVSVVLSVPTAATLGAVGTAAPAGPSVAGWMIAALVVVGLFVVGYVIWRRSREYEVSGGEGKQS